MSGHPDIVGDIWQKAVDLGLADPFGAKIHTAEARKALDDFLRARLAEIADRTLRDHAAELMRERRAVLFGARPVKSLVQRDDDLAGRLAELEARVARLEASAGAAEEAANLGGEPEPVVSQVLDAEVDPRRIFEDLISWRELRDGRKVRVTSVWRHDRAADVCWEARAATPFGDVIFWADTEEGAIAKLVQCLEHRS